MDWGKALKGWDRKNPFEDRNKPKGQFLTSAEKQEIEFQKLKKGWDENAKLNAQGNSGQAKLDSTGTNDIILLQQSFGESGDDSQEIGIIN